MPKRMKELAEILGLKLNEIFQIELECEAGEEWFYKLTKKGFFVLDNPGCGDKEKLKWVEADSEILLEIFVYNQDIVKVNEIIIRRRPCEKDGDSDAKDE